MAEESASARLAVALFDGWERALDARAREGESRSLRRALARELAVALVLHPGDASSVVRPLALPLGEQAARYGRPLADAAREAALVGRAILDENAAPLEIVVQLVASLAVAIADGHCRAAAARDRARDLLPADALAALEEGVIVLDAFGRVAHVAGAAAALLGVDAHAAIGRPAEVAAGELLVHARAERGRPPRLLALRALSTGKPTSPQLLHLHDAAPRPVETVGLPLRDGELVIGAVEIVRDRREIARRDDELRRAHRELRALHGRLLRGSRLQALGEVATGTALLVNNELNAIALALPLARSAPPDETERHLGTIEAAVGRAARLVAKLQELTTPPRASSPAPTDLNAAVVDAIDLVRPDLTGAARDRVVRVDARLDELPPALARTANLREVLCSLLVLARDGFPRGGVLHVRTRRCDSQVEVALRHEGALPSGTRAVALEAARHSAERAGVSLQVHADGDSVAYELRAPIAESTREEARPARAPHTRGRHVLLVDDDTGNRETMSELLRLIGHSVDAFDSSTEALAAARRARYDAALVDFAMPEMNGLDLARRLRSSHPSLRIALVTGWEPGPIENAGVFDAILRKPVDLAALRDFLDRGGDPAHP